MAIIDSFSLMYSILQNTYARIYHYIVDEYLDILNYTVLRVLGHFSQGRIGWSVFPESQSMYNLYLIKNFPEWLQQFTSNLYFHQQSLRQALRVGRRLGKPLFSTLSLIKMSFCQVENDQFDILLLLSHHVGGRFLIFFFHFSVL